MKKLQYLRKTIDYYSITDFKTKAEFDVTVIENYSGVHFDISCRGSFSSEGALECADLLKTLISQDYCSANIREGEQPGKIKVIKKATVSVKKLQEKQRRSFLSSGSNEENGGVTT